MRRRQAFGANNTKQYLLVCFGTRFSCNLEIIGALIPCDVGADLQLSLIVTPNPEFPQPRIHKECACMLRRVDDYNNEVCRRLSKGRQGMERCAALCSDGCIHWGTIFYCLLYPKMGRPRKPTKRQRTTYVTFPIKHQPSLPNPPRHNTTKTT